MAVNMKLSGKRLEEYLSLTRHYRFRIFTCRYSNREELVERPMIVLINTETGIPVRIMGLTDAAIYSVDQNGFSTHRYDLMTIVQFLNYVFFDHADRFRISEIEDLTLDMIQEYIYDYCKTRLSNGTLPSKRTILSHRSAVCQFSYRLCQKYKMRHLKKNDIMTVIATTDSQYRTKKVIEYKVQVVFHERQQIELKTLWRDMPNAFVQKLITAARLFDPEMVLAIVLSYRAGLREGEICSLRDEESIYGKSILCEKMLGRCINITISLTNDFLLRPDGTSVGKIKRKRRQPVYESYVPEIYDAYIEHRELVQDKNRRDCMPLFTNKLRSKDGYHEAMTTASYHARIKKLFDLVLPNLSNDPDPALQRFYYEMIGHTWGAHSFRHLFTVNLVVDENVDLATLKLLRGDRSDDAAEAYLKNKGLLRKKFNTQLNILFDGILKGDE